ANYKNLSIALLHFFESNFGDHLKDFYHENLDKRDDSGMNNFQKLDKLLLSHLRITSQPEELIKKLNKGLSTWTLKIDQERLEDLVKESINEVVGTMFGVNNNG
ncbi:MAG: hypothetical protein ACKO2Z_36185, partial [Sphaerospermopsis kisseleviana]